jgi:putative tricarboxylic transport membrane protein
VDYDLRRQDIYAALILCALSVLVVVESWRMPRDLQNWPAYASPGVVTGALGAVLFAMAIGLFARALKRGGARVGMRGADVRRYLADPRTRRLVVMTGLCALYLLSLGRGLPYHVTTGVYLAVAMLLFRAAAWWVVVLVSGVTTAAVAFVFNRIFLIPLP